MKFTIHLITATITVMLLIFGLAAEGVQAQDPVVRAVLFYSPTCPHCLTVINEVLPPLQTQYGESLEILGVNASEQQGSEMFHTALDQYGIPAEDRGVPTLIVDDLILVGSGQIPQEFPGIIDRGLESGGISWPDIPGLDAYLGGDPSGGEAAPEPIDHDPTPEPALSVAERFRQDPAGNTIAVIVLLGLVGTLVFAAVSWRDGIFASNPESYGWLVPVLSVIGLAVALYLSFVEVTQSEAICGPVGNCNAVQQSPYARLFGLMPVGLLGAAGYTFILVTWWLKRWAPESWRGPLSLVIWGSASLGLLFSMYLTFLEPFVIGATCLWCITSAVLMAALFLITTDPAREVLYRPDPEHLEA